jgi:type IV pilus assembly protein PilP
VDGATARQHAPAHQAHRATQAFHSCRLRPDDRHRSVLEVGVRQEVQQLNPLLQAELARPKQPLEAYSLDQIQMVGSVKIKGQQYALLKAGNLLYRAHVGEYAGQHFGKIIKITDSEVDLRELVQDATGDWVEHPATLQLQESTQ